MVYSLILTIPRARRISSMCWHSKINLKDLPDCNILPELRTDKIVDTNPVLDPAITFARRWPKSPFQFGSHLVIQCLLLYLVEIPAGMRHMKARQWYMVNRRPTPIERGNIAITHDRASYCVDAVI
jgi:hypothetical protein